MNLASSPPNQAFLGEINAVPHTLFLGLIRDDIHFEYTIEMAQVFRNTKHSLLVGSLSKVVIRTPHKFMTHFHNFKVGIQHIGSTPGQHKKSKKPKKEPPEGENTNWIHSTTSYKKYILHYMNCGYQTDKLHECTCTPIYTEYKWAIMKK